jgi:hypothetical protein
MPKLVDKDPEAPWCVTEAMSGLRARETINEEGSKPFVLAVGEAGGLKEEAGEFH